MWVKTELFSFLKNKEQGLLTDVCRNRKTSSTGLNLGQTTLKQLHCFICIYKLETVVWVSRTLISSMEILAAEDPGQVVHPLGHGFSAVDIVVDEPGDKGERRVEILCPHSIVVEER